MTSMDEIAKRITDRITQFKDISSEVEKDWESNDASKSVKEIIDAVIDELAQTSQGSDEAIVLATAQALLSSKLRRKSHGVA